MKALQQSIELDVGAQKNTTAGMSLTALCEIGWVDCKKNVTKFVEMLLNVFDTFVGMTGWSDTRTAAK